MDNEEKRIDRLYIPYGLNIEKEYFPGFGKKQLRQSVIGTIAMTAFGALVFLLTGAIPVLIICIVSGGFASVMVTTKSNNQLSVLDQIISMIRFKKEQQIFYFIYKYDDF
jgi:hypothetical protein